MECPARSGAQESPEEPPGAYGEEGLATMANWIPSQQGRKLVCEMCKHLMLLIPLQEAMRTGCILESFY